MFKKVLLSLAVIGMFSFTAAQDADAWVIRRRAPVRRAVARTVLPPYPVARRVVAGPVYRTPVVYAAPAPVYYGTGVYVW